VEVGDDREIHEIGMRGIVGSMAFQGAYGTYCKHFIWAHITNAGVDAAVISNGLESRQVLDIVFCTFLCINTCHREGILEFVESLVGEALVDFESECAKKRNIAVVQWFFFQNKDQLCEKREDMLHTKFRSLFQKTLTKHVP